jgi:hypothetical protein
MSSAQLVPDDNNVYHGETELSHKNDESEPPLKTLKDKSSSKFINSYGS